MATAKRRKTSEVSHSYSLAENVFHFGLYNDIDRCSSLYDCVLEMVQ